jgi:hypothetical protein
VTDLEAKIVEEMSPDADAPEGDDPEQESAREPVDIGNAPEAPEPGPRSQQEIDALADRLRKESDRHAKRVEEIMGDDFALLVPNPTDWTPGYIFNVPPMHPTPEQVAELHALLGDSSQLELQDAEDAEGCDKCSALGEVRTGSRKPGQETKPCIACNGSGWRTKSLPMQPLAPVPQIGNGYTATDAAPNQFQVADRYGRPFGHPHYNLEPANVGV